MSGLGVVLTWQLIQVFQLRGLLQSQQCRLTCLMCEAAAGGLGERSEPHIFC